MNAQEARSITNTEGKKNYDRRLKHELNKVYQQIKESASKNFRSVRLEINPCYAYSIKEKLENLDYAVFMFTSNRSKQDGWITKTEYYTIIEISW